MCPDHRNIKVNSDSQDDDVQIVEEQQIGISLDGIARRAVVPTSDTDDPAGIGSANIDVL